MRGAIPPLPEYVFMAWWLVKHRNFTLPTFTFTFTSYRKLNIDFVQPKCTTNYL
jgi:hypothetical protein